jgi:hypothetical protein
MTPRAGRVTRAIRQDLPLSRSGTRRSRSTRNRYAEVYSVHVAPWLDDVPLGQFGAPQLSGWQAALITAGVSPGTIHKARTLLSSVLGHAAENGAIIGWRAADSAARRAHRVDPGLCRLLSALARDVREYRFAIGRPPEKTLILLDDDRKPCDRNVWQMWRADCWRRPAVRSDSIQFRARMT